MYVICMSMYHGVLVVEYVECGCVDGQNKKRQKSDEETKRLSKKAKMTVEDVDDDDDSDVEVCYLLTG